MPGPCAQSRSSTSILSAAIAKASTHTNDISGLYHTALTLAVYASQPGSTSGPRKTRYRLGASLGRVDGAKLTSTRIRYEVSLSSWHPPPPGFSWRTSGSPGRTASQAALPGPPQIRTCGIPASGSSMPGFATHRAQATTRTRRRRISGVAPATRRGPCYPLDFREDGSEARGPHHRSAQRLRAPAPLFAPQGPLGRFPYFAARIAALRRLATHPHRPSFRRPGVPAEEQEITGPPRFLGIPDVCSPCSWTPADLHARPLRPIALAHFGIACDHCYSIGSSDDISGLYHTALTLAVYASQPGSSLRTTQDSLPAGGQP